VVKKSLKYIVLSLLVVALTACSAGGIGYQEIKQALEIEGLEVQYTDDMSEDFYGYEINGKAILNVSVEKNSLEMKESKESLEQNAREKQYEIRTFGVGNLLFGYYPPEEPDQDLENKVRNAIENLKN
jgi:hypothetical protein